jgi:DNA-binding CsgD family transcriptional regulator
MREVSVRILHFALDLARTADLDEAALTDGVPSVALRDGKRPDWIDFDDMVEIIERLEERIGGPEPLARAFREAVPTAYPEIRAFASVFVRPIPAFRFVMTRLIPTMYRNMQIDEIESLGGDRVRWRQTIPEPFRASVAFHRGSIPFSEVFPRHLDLPEARVVDHTITPRTAEFVVDFPPSQPIEVRGARAVSSAASILAVQLEDAFATIAARIRAEPRSRDGAAAPDSAAASRPNGALRDWADRLALSPRQRDVFALLVEGRANKEIAASLRCSERNVEFHVGRILRAARVTSRSELLVKVLGARA